MLTITARSGQVSNKDYTLFITVVLVDNKWLKISYMAQNVAKHTTNCFLNKYINKITINLNMFVPLLMSILSSVFNKFETNAPRQTPPYFSFLQRFNVLHALLVQLLVELAVVRKLTGNTSDPGRNAREGGQIVLDAG